MVEPYFTNDYVKISWDSEAECVITEWSGYTGGNQGKIQLGSQKALDLVIEKKAQKWLIDLQKIRVLDQSDQAWLSQEFIPRATQQGIHYVALVLPASALAQLSTNNVTEKVVGLELEIGNFDSFENARKYLLSIK